MRSTPPALQTGPSRADLLPLAFLHPKANPQLTLNILLAPAWCGLAIAVHAQSASYSGATSAFAAWNITGTATQGIATDANGDVFIADDGAAPTVYEMKRTGPGVYSAPVALPGLATGNYVYLRGIAIDSNGNLWVADYGNYSTTPGQVYELKYNSGSFATPVAVGTGWESPWAIAADTSGDVFVTDNAAQTISEISHGASTIAVFSNASTTISQPRGIAVDSSNNLFVMDGNVDRVMKLAPPYTSAASTVNPTQFQGPDDIALDVNGNIFGVANGATVNANAIALAPLGNYGGPAKTLIPLPGSPAICAGHAASIPSSLTTDQRGLPSGAIATFSPANLSTNSGQQSVTMVIQTAAVTASLQSTRVPGRSRPPFALALVLLPLFGIRRLRRHGKHLSRPFCLLLLLLAGATTLVLNGCGGSVRGSSQTYTLTITVTSGNIQHTANTTLNVQ